MSDASLALLSSQAILDALPWQAAVVSHAGEIRAVNDAWRSFGLANGGTGEDIGANYLAVCDRAPPEDRDASSARRALTAVLGGEVDRWQVEYPCHSPTTPHWFVMTVSALRLGGEDLGALVTHHEVTAQHESQRGLKAFLSQAAHDLRSPLRHLSSFPELLESDLGPQLGEPHRGWLSAIRNAANHMRTQVDNLLALARSRIDPVEYAPVALTNLVQRRFDQHCTMQRTTARLEVGDLGTLISDEKLLTVMIDNLITNVLKHGRGTTDLTLQVTVNRTNPGETMLWFDDNGPGFTGPEPSELLRPYRRGDGSSTRRGLGLGLTMVAQVVERLGGTLDLGHATLGGARVEVRLPNRPIGTEPPPWRPEIPGRLG